MQGIDGASFAAIGCALPGASAGMCDNALKWVIAMTDILGSPKRLNQ